MKNIFLIAFLSVISMSWSQTENFSDENVSKFANAYKAVRSENMSFQLNKLTAIEDAGLSSDEFTEIHIMLRDSDEQPSATQRRQYNQALNNIENLQKDIQEDMERIIVEHGLKVETYQAIAKASKNDISLKNKIQRFLK